MNNKIKPSVFLNFLGIIIFALGFFCLCLDMIPLKYNCLLFLISVLLMLPDSIIFVVRKYKENHRFGFYWISKFLGLIIGIIIFAVGFIILVLKD